MERLKRGGRKRGDSEGEKKGVIEREKGGNNTGVRTLDAG